MNALDIVIPAALLACVIAYLFGVTCGRAQQGKLCAQRLEKQRQLLFSERRSAHVAQQAQVNMQADMDRLTAMLERQQSGFAHDVYTLRLAAHELDLAAATFTALHSGRNHQAEQLSKAMHEIADRLGALPTLAANETALPLGLEDAA